MMRENMITVLNRVQFETRRFQFRSSPPWATLEGWYYGFQTGRGLETPVKSEISPLNPQHIAGYKSLLDRVIDPGLLSQRSVPTITCLESQLKSAYWVLDNSPLKTRVEMSQAQYIGYFLLTIPSVWEVRSDVG